MKQEVSVVKLGISALQGGEDVNYDTELEVDYIEPEEKGRSKGKLATVFQIWERREQVRPKVKIENRGYIEKNNPS